MTEAFANRLARLQRYLGIGGLITLAGAAVGAFTQPRQFFFSYLFAYLFWLGLSLGCFAVTMIHQLTGGRWGYPTRRFLEAGFMALPLMVPLLVPILFGLSQLYPWARAADVVASKSLQGRHIYQNNWACSARLVFFLLVWIALAWSLRRWSLEQDTTKDAGPTRSARTLSGPGLIIYSIFGTFASVDWIMSLETDWTSTIFAVIVLIGQILTAYAFSVVMLTLFRKQVPLTAVVNGTHYHHLGNLLLTFVLFWTYLSFSQLLIVYSADLPHELAWYLHRIAGSWKWVITLIALFHFFLPFFLLLFRAVKRNVTSLSVLASLLFGMQLLNTYWLIMPTFHPRGLAISWLDFAAPIGVGGLWMSVVLSRLRAVALLPQQDPGLQFAFTYGC